MSTEIMSPPAEETRKRKHKGEPREPRKKRKQEEKLQEAEREAEQEDPAGIVQAEPQPDPTSLPDSERLGPPSVKSDKKKKKQQQDARTVQSSAAENGTTATQSAVAVAVDRDEDTELPDVSEILQAETIENPEEAWSHTAYSTEEIVPGQLQSSSPTPFSATRISLYVPVPAISLDSPLSAVCALHLSPLLLTYYPPVNGIVLAYQDATLSAPPQTGLNRPLRAPTNNHDDHSQKFGSSNNIPPPRPTETLSLIGEESATPWLWLTATFLVYNPQPTDELTGVINAQSEGLVGLVAYNYFQTSIARDRIPKHWAWSGATTDLESGAFPATRRRKSRKGKLNDHDGPSQEHSEPEPEPDGQDTLSHNKNKENEDQNQTPSVHEQDDPTAPGGTFINTKTHTPISSVQRFRIVDSELVPLYTRGTSTFTVQTEGTLLSESEEMAVREREKMDFERRMLGRGGEKSQMQTQTMMSGAIGGN